ncbi:MAG: class I SAM-dependent methyltransferase [Brevundimonas sp.]|uniref:class I SAM-dependent methyltransferase n=1 Tax=Brevundimonas sp. TaxID=1871086 RepID=UPI003919430C
MSLRDRVRKAVRTGRQAVLPEPEFRTASDQEAWEDAVALWNDLFAPFSPILQGADVIELGCGDGRLLGAAMATGGARSAVGFERQAWWNGGGGGVAWRPGDITGLDLRVGIDGVSALDEGAADLILARELDGFIPLDSLEFWLAELYGLLRPGGEMLARVRCGDGRGDPQAPGYGFLTPTAWTVLVLGAGFEIADTRRVWRAPAQQGAAAERLPHASDDERLTAELHLHLIRPWESWELDALHGFGDQGRGRKRKN